MRARGGSVKTHWLYGSGPDKLLDFQREVDAESDCSKCVHREVCDQAMERRCENYVFGTSAERSCQSCLHKYTRYDAKDPVPCFSCPWFMKDTGQLKTPRKTGKSNA